ncbi:MAG: hypothetical protein IPL96_10470 [Holophagaceae bacterium]|nr:hypothetical protein [Holophagaceae bacterium]
MERKRALRSLAIDSKNPQPETVLEDVKGYDLSADGKKLLAWKGNDLLVFDAGAKPDPVKSSRI